jgi:hypothetical protein
MTIANALRLGFGAAIALGLLFDQPATSESVAREAEAQAVIEAIESGDAAEAAVLEAAVAQEESCSAHPRAERVRTDAGRGTRRL